MRNRSYEANKSKGFSLVELIVVIAIMAVMVAVLAPALLSYVERSRAQKDDSAMAEVTNAIKLIATEQDVYDELIYYTCANQFSCYVDNDLSTYNEANKIDWGNGYYYYPDNTRVHDERNYFLNGNMRGVTISFARASSVSSAFTENTISVGEAGVNVPGITNRRDSYLHYFDRTDFVSETKLKDMKLKNANTSHTYNRLRSIIGDTISLTSQTYRNSYYTVFIKIGTTGGNEGSAQNAIEVYGQWSGTNLPHLR